MDAAALAGLLNLTENRQRSKISATGIFVAVAPTFASVSGGGPLLRLRGYLSQPNWHSADYASDWCVFSTDEKYLSTIDVA